MMHQAYRVQYNQHRNMATKGIPDKLLTYLKRNKQSEYEVIVRVRASDIEVFLDSCLDKLSKEEIQSAHNLIDDIHSEEGNGSRPMIIKTMGRG